jgi:hypothetical protein
MKDKNLAQVESIRIQKVLEKLRDNRMQAILLENKDMVVPELKKLITSAESVSLGGSMTLAETGATAYITSLPLFIDREKDQAKALVADVFVAGTNAITENGELYNVDGRGNRNAPMIFGPKKVILVAGINKIVPTIEDAIRRVKTIAAPANALRLNKTGTFCYTHGTCANNNVFAPTACPCPICSSFVVLGRQMVKDRITILLVKEELGF